MFRMSGVAVVAFLVLVGGCAATDHPTFSCAKIMPGNGTSDQTSAPAHKDAAGYLTCQ